MSTTEKPDAKTTKLTKTGKERKPKAPTEKWVVIRKHPKYPGLCQTFSGTNWVMVEPVKGFESTCSHCNQKTAAIAKALIGGDSGVFIGLHGTALPDEFWGDEPAVPPEDATTAATEQLEELLTEPVTPKVSIHG